jgi:hypothetical protein
MKTLRCNADCVDISIPLESSILMDRIIDPFREKFLNNRLANKDPTWQDNI